mgnify:CR=1 FL=1
MNTQALQPKPEAGNGITQKQSANEEFAALTWADIRQSNPLAAARLIGLFSITSCKILELTLASIRRRWTPELAMQKACDWAEQVLVVCGIEATLEGGIPPGPVLLVANHRSYIDIAPILAHIPCAFVAKSELRSWPILGKGASLGNTVFVERANPTSRKATRSAILDKLEAGHSVVVFPEGTTSRAPGMLPFRPGIFKTIAGTNFPVVPIAIEYEDPNAAYVGNDTFLGHFLRVFAHRKTKVSLHFGPPQQSPNPTHLQTKTQAWIKHHVTLPKPPLTLPRSPCGASNGPRGAKGPTRASRRANAPAKPRPRRSPHPAVAGFPLDAETAVFANPPQLTQGATKTSPSTAFGLSVDLG